MSMKKENQQPSNDDADIEFDVINLSFSSYEMQMVCAALSLVILICDDMATEKLNCPVSPERMKELVRIAQSAIKKFETIVTHERRTKDEQQASKN
jgi:hypothetical protein